MQPGNTCRQGPRKLASGPIPSLAHTLRDANLKTKILDNKPVTFSKGYRHPVVGQFDVEVASRNSRDGSRRHVVRQLTDKLAATTFFRMRAFLLA
jgi:hypothetical protein